VKILEASSKSIRENGSGVLLHELDGQAHLNGQSGPNGKPVLNGKAGRRTKVAGRKIAA